MKNIYFKEILSLSVAASDDSVKYESFRFVISHIPSLKRVSIFCYLSVNWHLDFWLIVFLRSLLDHVSTGAHIMESATIGVRVQPSNFREGKQWKCLFLIVCSNRFVHKAEVWRYTAKYKKTYNGSSKKSSYILCWRNCHGCSWKYKL